jgi:hypothetical protein
MTEEEVNTTHNTIRVYRDEANKFKWRTRDVGIAYLKADNNFNRAQW